MKVDRREWVFVLLVSTLLLTWSSIPLWTGYALQNEKVSFTGAFFDSPDYAAHVAMIRAGMQGDWPYSFRFTSESHPPQYTRLFYLALGQINRVLGFEPEVLFQVSRWGFGYAALFALFMLSRWTFPRPTTHWLAFFLAVLGSGLGSIQLASGWVPGPIAPVDLWLIDAYMLFSLAIFPHFAFTLALTCIVLLAFFDFLETRRQANILLVTGAALVVQFVNPLAFLLVDVTMAASALVTWYRNRQIEKGHAFALGVITSTQIPLLVYNYLILVEDPFGKLYTMQHETPSPAVVYYLLGFALFWPPVLAGAIWAAKKKDPILLSMLVWVTAAFLLAYAPFVIQRRFLLGITIPLSFLATRGLDTSIRWLAMRRGWIGTRIPLLTLSAVLLISLNTLILFPVFAAHLQSYPAEYFYPHPMDRAFAWVIQNTGEEDFVLGAEDTGRLIAQKTGRPVYLGHPMETLNYAEKVKEVSAFYRGELTTEWLANSPVRWVVYGPYEQALAPDFRGSPALELVFQQNGISIYRVGKVRAMLDSGPAHDRSP